jgi:multidrug resistance efflux pump
MARVGYLDVTKLPRIHAGQRARIPLKGANSEIEEHLESISSGIADPNA